MKKNESTKRFTYVVYFPHGDEVVFLSESGGRTKDPIDACYFGCTKKDLGEARFVSKNKKGSLVGILCETSTFTLHDA